MLVDQQLSALQITGARADGIRLLSLDMLRGLAIILVLGRHILFIPDTIPPFVHTVLVTWRQVGWIGVDLFFVLSGFLVSGLLFTEQRDTGAIRPGRFLIRRGFKIYPSFYLFLAVSLATSYYFGIPSMRGVRAIFGEALFIQNYIPGLWDHTWSLAVEEHFYLLLVAILFVLVTREKTDVSPFTFLLAIATIICLLLLVIRVLVARVYPPGSWVELLPFTHFRIDSLLFGAVLAYFYNYHHRALATFVSRFRQLLLVCCFALLLLPFIFSLETSRIMYSYGFTALYLGFGILLLLLVVSKQPRNTHFLSFSKPFAIIGRYSYAIYLWHMMVYLVSRKLFDPRIGATEFYWQVCSYLLGAIALGFIVTQLVEEPMLRIRQRYFP